MPALRTVLVGVGRCDAPTKLSSPALLDVALAIWNRPLRRRTMLRLCHSVAAEERALARFLIGSTRQRASGFYRRWRAEVNCRCVPPGRFGELTLAPTDGFRSGRAPGIRGFRLVARTKPSSAARDDARREWSRPRLRVAVAGRCEPSHVRDCEADARSEPSAVSVGVAWRD